MLTIHPIAFAHNNYKDKFGIPRQSGRVEEVETQIVFTTPYRNSDALRGIEQFTHIWLLWGFSANPPQEAFSPTVRPPRLGGNVRMGVFATRSPFRPNPIGLSSVRLLRTEHHPQNGTILIVSGADLLDNTPIYDIKPYIPYTDSHPDASNGFAQEQKDYRLPVHIPDALRQEFDDSFCRIIEAVLSEDPRPAYQHDAQRVYAMTYAEYTIRFRVTDKVEVLSIEH